MSDNEQGSQKQVAEQVEQEPLSNLDAAILNVQRALIAIHNQLAQLNARMTEQLLFKRASVMVDARHSGEELRIDMGLFQRIGNTVIHPVAWGLIIPDNDIEKDKSVRENRFMYAVAEWAQIVGIHAKCEGEFKVKDHNEAIKELRKRTAEQKKPETGVEG